MSRACMVIPTNLVDVRCTSYSWRSARLEGLLAPLGKELAERARQICSTPEEAVLARRISILLAGDHILASLVCVPPAVLFRQHRQHLANPQPVDKRS
eukprot:scaffold7226_cov387-Prasinococcus_capsulatus_cf.AAC.15